MLDLRKVNHVIEIARQGGFAKAAATLNITQSALTRSVQILEDHLGIQVFERGPRGIRLTREGEEFIEGGTRLLEEAATLERFARSARTTERGRVRMGAAPASFRLFWFEVLPTFAARYPGIEIATTAETVDEISAQLQSGDIDFAIGSLEALRANGALQVENIANLAVSPFVRRGHPLDRAEEPSFEELLAYPMVGPSPADPHRQLMNNLANACNAPYSVPHLVVDSFSLSLRIVERTDAFSFAFSRYAAAPEFDETFRVWHGWEPVPPLPFHIATRTGWNRTAAAKPLIEMLEQRIRRLADDAPV
ncbi:MAG TPA: LysR family transcriptional regulator [Sphingopyxis sp.]|uniref:LysR family transcriptional regulator n=1 Tax=Sphingopyxis sp. TaxID=1908224 RepID=UPI002E3437D0|nr:LysR family transcriptional regulator [Sphingopyxis sp.]HEX2814579.1 LysR family transcriptional regulator [Sphingopyxis sp.]